MTHTIQLLDKARDLCSPPTDYQLAKVLGLSRQTISRCRNHGGTLDNKAVRDLARFLEQPFETVLALVELDREKDPQRRSYWEKVAPRVVPSLVVGLVAAALWRLSPELGDGSQIALTWAFIGATPYTFCEVWAALLCAAAATLFLAGKPVWRGRSYATA